MDESGNFYLVIMLDNLSKYHLILASNSPRRKQLLASLGLSFEQQVLPDLDETYPAHLQGGDIAEHIARAKAQAYLPTLQENDLLLTADTIVYNEGKVYGKPQNREEACAMLVELSGKTHHVYTGVCLATTQWQRSFATDTKVSFATLSQDEIAYYVDTFQPYDKAGAYGIQEWIGYVAVENIEGSYFNVMGLPIQRIYQELKQL